MPAWGVGGQEQDRVLVRAAAAQEPQQGEHGRGQVGEGLLFQERGEQQLVAVPVAVGQEVRGFQRAAASA
ncbi:hypothetical protein [Streptomyces sp. NPDC017958]|uniref:hypothetical protein n=1 Tax=Streptomyces sp. NPDC017958 TaxID=3365021 RepID=UPI00378B2E8E